MVYLRIRNAHESYYPRWQQHPYLLGVTPTWKTKEERLEQRIRMRDSEYEWYLSLVGSRRQEGRVRQLSLEYLGGIEKWGLKDLFWLATGTTAFKQPWNSTYDRIKPFPTIQVEYGQFDIGKALVQIVQKVHMAPCVVEKLFGEGVSFPFPATFQEVFTRLGALEPILRIIRQYLERALKQGYFYTDGQAGIWLASTWENVEGDGKGRERAKFWLEEWLPSVVSSLSTLRYPLHSNPEASPDTIREAGVETKP